MELELGHKTRIRITDSGIFYVGDEGEVRINLRTPNTSTYTPPKPPPKPAAAPKFKKIRYAGQD